MNMLKFYALLLLAFCIVSCKAIVVVSGNAPVMCLNDDGQSVDWSITYKLPILKRSVEPYSTGWSYAYITSELQAKGSETSSENQPNEGWTVSEKLLNQTDSIILRTLDQVQPNNSLSTVYYSDQPPGMNAPGAHRAHSKGALVLDEKSDSGFWLVHTVPRFPQPRGSVQEFLSNARTYGQTFMCISFKLSESGRTILKHIANLRPQVYDSRINDDLLVYYPELKDLTFGALKGRRLRGKGFHHMALSMETRGGELLSLYSQSGDAGIDLYEWLKRELRSNLYVESWRNGVGTHLKSNCPANEFRVNNIKDLKVKLNTGKNLTWNYKQDHSKWAIAEDEKLGIICLSDLNRMKSQFYRGGGSVCIKCPSCWRTFSNSVLDVEPCPIPDDDTNKTQSEHENSTDDGQNLNKAREDEKVVEYKAVEDKS